MAINFGATTFEQAQEYFSSVKKNTEKTVEARAFLDGDDWRKGKNWTGADLGDGDIGKYLKSEIEKKLTAKGSVKSTARRHRRGVVGRIPSWLVTWRNAPADPDAETPPEIQELINEAQIIFNEFWKNSRVHRTVKKLISDYLAQNRGLMRLFFVQSESGEASVDIPEDIRAAVRLIHLFHEKPEQGVVVFDKETLKKSSFFRYEKGNITFIEQCYVENGETIFRTLSGNGYLEKKAEAVVSAYLDAETGEETDELRLPLEGKLLVFEIEGIEDAPFVTPAMISQQKLQNKGWTMLSHTLDTDGFRSTLLGNALPPGEFVDKDGKKVFVPSEQGFKFGPGEIQFIGGLPTVEHNAQTKTTKSSITTPTFHQSEPIGISTFADTIRETSKAILEDADQRHIAISVDMELSGVSQQEARADYAGSLEDTKSDLDDVMSDVFETVLALVAYVMNQPGRYNELQVTFSAIINPGPVSVEERAQAVSEGDAGYRTTESVMESIGISDPDAMAAAVAKQQEENPDPTLDPNDPNNPKKDPKIKEEEQ